MIRKRRRLSLARLVAAMLVLAGAASAISCASADARAATQDTSGGGGPGRNVILVLVDGLRWQELFSGAEESLISKEYGGIDEAKLPSIRGQFMRDTPQQRRQALMPFFWSTIATEGQLIGNQHLGSIAQVANSMNFSYPGYSEMICGFADPRIDSNDKRPNPNVTVFEWLNQQPGFEDSVAVFGAWDTVAWIVNRERCGHFVSSGWELVPDDGTLSPRARLLNELKQQMPRRWPAEPDDAITFHAAAEYLKQHRPRVMWITFGETDEFAHDGRYDLYLESAYRTDAMMRRLWELIQSTDGYRDNTTLIIAPDHGRGTGPQLWRDHGEKVPDSRFVWIAMIGPDTPVLGERSATADPVLLAQVAATLAAAVGHDYPAAEPRAAAPIPGALRH